MKSRPVKHLNSSAVEKPKQHENTDFGARPGALEFSLGQHEAQQ